MRLSSLLVLAGVVVTAASFAPSASAGPQTGPIYVRPLPVRPQAPRFMPAPGSRISVPPIYSQHLVNTRGIDPHGAIAVAGWGGSAGRYATQATPVRQATQATQARQYVQPRFVRPMPRLSFFNPRGPRP